MTVKGMLVQAGDGTAIPAGFVGQRISGASDAATTAAGSGVNKTITTIPMTKGTWLIQGQVLFDRTASGVSSFTRGQIAFTTNSSIVGTIANVNGYDVSDLLLGPSGGFDIGYFNFTADISADATYNITATLQYGGSSTGNVIRAVIRATRLM